MCSALCMHGHQSSQTACAYAQELDELKLMHEQQQAEQREAPQPGSPAASVHQQDELIAQLTDQLQQSRQDLASQRAKTMALQQVWTGGSRHGQHGFACIHRMHIYVDAQSHT